MANFFKLCINVYVIATLKEAKVKGSMRHLFYLVKIKFKVFA